MPDFDLIALESLLKHNNKRLEAVESELKQLNVTMAQNTAHLAEHMRRTEAVEDRLEPLEDHVKLMHWLMKGAMILAGLPASIYYILRIVGKA